MQFGPGLGWLKQLMPRGLYGRTVLILLLPVFTVVLVVTVMFLQRHFEDVTRQMTGSVAREISFIARRIDQSSGPDAARVAGGQLADNLGFGLLMPGEPVGNSRKFYDISGRVVADELRSGLPQLRDVELGDLKQVRLAIGGRHGPYTLSFPRAWVSASNPHQLLVLLAITAAMMTVVAGLFMRNQLRPIRRLALAAEDYGRGRVTPYRPGGAIEIRSAGAAFLDMRNRLERQSEQRALMLSGVSHDLRTPLTRLQLSLSMLDSDMPAEPDEILAMQRDVEEMAAMVNAFLAYSRDAALDSPAENLLLAPFLQRIVDDANRAGHKVALTISGQAAGAAARFRADMLRRAIENLIGNAVRYGTKAQVTLDAGKRTLHIIVEDDGPGIPKDQREEALRPFARLDPARGRGGGTGLGLAIAADGARIHGGQLRLGRSEKMGGLRAEIVLAK